MSSVNFILSIILSCVLSHTVKLAIEPKEVSSDSSIQDLYDGIIYGTEKELQLCPDCSSALVPSAWYDNNQTCAYLKCTSCDYKTRTVAVYAYDEMDVAIAIVEKLFNDGSLDSSYGDNYWAGFSKQGNLSKFKFEVDDRVRTGYESATMICPYCNHELKVKSSTYITTVAYLYCLNCGYKSPEIHSIKPDNKEFCIDKLNESFMTNNWIRRNYD